MRNEKMASIDKMIQWFKDREGKVTYSMTNRYGPNSYDCSSAVYYSLIAGGFLPSGSMGNTETLYGLEGSLLLPIKRAEVKKGDIFVAGIKGGSGGSDGHTGVFLSNDTIIHCTYPKNGIATTPATGWMGDYSGLPVYYYRLKGAITVNKPSNNIKAGDVVVLTEIATKWKSYANGAARRFNTNEFCTSYTVEKRNPDNSLLIRSSSVTSAWGWIYDWDAEKKPSNTLQKGDKVKLKSTATHWSSGAIFNNAQKNMQFSVRERSGNQLIIDSGVSRGWIYDWDVSKI